MAAALGVAAARAALGDGPGSAISGALVLAAAAAVFLLDAPWLARLLPGMALLVAGGLIEVRPALDAGAWAGAAADAAVLGGLGLVLVADALLRRSGTHRVWHAALGHLLVLASLGRGLPYERSALVGLGLFFAAQAAEAAAVEFDRSALVGRLTARPGGGAWRVLPAAAAAVALPFLMVLAGRRLPAVAAEAERRGLILAVTALGLAGAVVGWRKRALLRSVAGVAGTVVALTGVALAAPSPTGLVLATGAATVTTAVVAVGCRLPWAVTLPWAGAAATLAAGAVARRGGPDRRPLRGPRRGGAAGSRPRTGPLAAGSTHRAARALAVASAGRRSRPTRGCRGARPRSAAAPVADRPLPPRRPWRLPDGACGAGRLRSRWRRLSPSAMPTCSRGRGPRSRPGSASCLSPRRWWERRSCSPGVPPGGCWQTPRPEPLSPGSPSPASASGVGAYHGEAAPALLCLAALLAVVWATRRTEGWLYASLLAALGGGLAGAPDWTWLAATAAADAVVLGILAVRRAEQEEGRVLAWMATALAAVAFGALTEWGALGDDPVADGRGLGGGGDADRGHHPGPARAAGLPGPPSGSCRRWLWPPGPGSR